MSFTITAQAPAAAARVLPKAPSCPEGLYHLGSSQMPPPNAATTQWILEAKKAQEARRTILADLTNAQEPIPSTVTVSTESAFTHIPGKSIYEQLWAHWDKSGIAPTTGC